MAAPAARLRDIVAATRPRGADGAAPAAPWTRPALAGRLVELSGAGSSAALTFAVALVLDAQRRGETCAWVASRASSFHPPDVAENGVDLDALPVVRVPEAGDVPRAAERLVRSGAFDLVVLDLATRAGPAGREEERHRPDEFGGRTSSCRAQIPRRRETGRPDVAPPLLARLLALAERHAAAVVFLTGKTAESPSLSPLVSLRAEARRGRTQGEGEDEGVVCELVALRDRRRPAGWRHTEVRRGPDGVR